MLENRIETIVNSSNSFGKINVILYFKAPHIHIEIIYSDIIRLFKPDEVKGSLFDLNKMEMEDIEISTFLNQNNNSILRILFIKENEEIIVEYYKDQFIIEHLFRPKDIRFVDGYSLLSQYCKTKNNFILVIGYELSINIDSYNSSLKENLSDKSMHPIFLMKDNNGNHLTEEYISYTNKVNEQKIEIIREYLKLIGISSSCR